MATSPTDYQADLAIEMEHPSLSSHIETVNGVHDQKTSIYHAPVALDESGQHNGDNIYNYSSLAADRRRLLLDHLNLNNIHERQNMIESRFDPFGDTFRWIFDTNAEHEFARWLKGEGNDPF